MVTIYALLSALSYGSADYYGGLASRKNPSTAIVAWSQAVGILVALISAPLLGAESLRISDLLWGMAAGLAGATGVGILYKGLASGLASVVSPVAALTGASLPVFFAVLSGERPGMLTWAGVALALPAILLLSTEKEEHRHHVLKSLKLGLLSGCGFSGFFIMIAQTGEGSGIWPLLAARLVSVPVFMAFTFLQFRTFRIKKGNRKHTFIAGLLDMGANVFYLLATRTGFLVTAVVLSALYPAPTVIMQRLYHDEKLSLFRIGGLFLAITGAALIGVGNYL